MTDKWPNIPVVFSRTTYEESRQTNFHYGRRSKLYCKEMIDQLNKDLRELAHPDFRYFRNRVAGR